MLPEPWVRDLPAEPVPADGGLTPEWIAELAAKERALEDSLWN